MLMAFSVADLLALPVLARARPEVVSGTRLTERPVRWVHTSEIYDIAPLLKGGEVLLTTGLGLVAVAPDARRRYIAALARVGLAALVMELGRTFSTVPDDIVAEARRLDLPLVLLHGVVPFVEVSEAAHSIILGGELISLRATDSMRDELLQAFGSSRGLVEFVGAIGKIAGCVATVYTIGGELIAGSGPDDELVKEYVEVHVDDRAVGSVDGAAESRFAFSSSETGITVSGESWGRLVLWAPSTPRLRVVLAAAAPLIAIDVQRYGVSPAHRSVAGAELLRDIVTGRYLSTAELTSRAAGVGLTLRPGQRAIALCVPNRPHPSRPPGPTPTQSVPSPTASILIAARAAAARVFGTALVAEHEGDILIGAAVRPRKVRTVLDRFAVELCRELRFTTGGGVLVGASPVVETVSALVSAFAQARETARMALRLTPSATVVLAADFALYQLLMTLVDDATLEQFVTAQLGALLEHDARTGAGLVLTLDSYLAAGMSKTRAAETLGIRRQTLYSRLERISALLGGLDLENRERRTALDLALVSWRLRLAAPGSSR